MPVSNSHRIVKNTGFLFFRMLIVLGVGLYTSRMILKYLGVEDFGIYNVVGSVIVIFSFLKQALNAATSRFISFEIGKGNTNDIKKIFSMSINCHIILAIILVFVLEVIGVWFLNTHLNIPQNRMYAANWVFQFTLISFFLGIVFNSYTSAIIAYEKMDFYALISLGEAILKLAIVFCLVISGIDRLILYGFLLTCITLLVGLCNFIYVRKYLPGCRYTMFWDKKVVRQLTSYSGWSLVVNLVDVGTNQGINICFNIFLGVVANASMGIANQVIGHMYQFLTNFSTSYNPQIIKSYAAKRYDYFMSLIFSASKISYLILFFVSVPIILNIEFILKIWLGEYPAMAPAFIKAIILFYLIDASQAPMWQSVHATGRIKVHQIMMSAIKAFTLPSVYFVLRAGYSGQTALYAWVIVNLCCAIARTLYLRRLIQLNVMDYLTSVVGKIIIVSVLAIPLPYYLSTIYEDGWIRLLVVSAVSCSISGLLIYFVALSVRERELIKSMPIVKKLFRR